MGMIEREQCEYVIKIIFEANKCSVHLCWDPEGDFAQKHRTQAKRTTSKDNTIHANEFSQDTCALSH
jgi:hypothetical protein